MDDFNFDDFLNDIKSNLDSDIPSEIPREATEPPQETCKPNRGVTQNAVAGRKEANRIVDAGEKMQRAGNRMQEAGKKISGFVSLVVLILVLVVIVRSCGKGNNETDNTTANATVASTAVEQTAEQAEAETDGAIPIETLDASIKLVVSSTWGENYRLEKDGDSYVIYTWADGLTSDALAAQTGDEELLDAWNTIVNNCVASCADIQNTYQDNGYDIIVSWEILNDMNMENTLASLTAYGVFYDFVNGIDLLAGQ